MVDDLRLLKEGIQNSPENPFPSSKYQDVFYHGSKIDINVFDPSKIGSATDEGTYGKGFYFADNASDAMGFGGNIAKAYLNITNPFVWTDVDDEASKKYKMTADDITKELIRAGYDSVVVNDNGKGYAEYVVFNSDQIRTLADEALEAPEKPSSSFDEVS